MRSRHQWAGDAQRDHEEIENFPLVALGTGLATMVSALSPLLSEVTAMFSATRCRLFERTAEDLMTRDVVCIPQAMTLRGAAHRLIDLDISGAPVLDDEGQCVGILSRSDLVRFLDRGAPLHGDAYEEFTAEWGMATLETLPLASVSDLMTRPVLTARTDTPVRELARLMQRSHVHRIVIIGDQGEVVGIVTTMDILAALAEEEDWPAQS